LGKNVTDPIQNIVIFENGLEVDKMDLTKLHGVYNAFLIIKSEGSKVQLILNQQEIF
jgi:hypothetical protein